jgi:hypothetical protein
MDANAMEVVIIPMIAAAGAGTAFGAAWLLVRRAIGALADPGHAGPRGRHHSGGRPR